MKALMGDIAKKVRQDTKGREQMRQFLVSKKDSATIDTSDGVRYTISRNRPEK